MARDNFSEETKKILARRVNYICSNPDCRCSTSGPHTEDDKAINIGEASHICAADSGGKRYDPNMAREDRISPKNGIWLCRKCGKLIDSDEVRYTVGLLHAWKKEAENRALRDIEGDTDYQCKTDVAQFVDKAQETVKEDFPNEIKIVVNGIVCNFAGRVIDMQHRINHHPVISTVAGSLVFQLKNNEFSTYIKFNDKFVLSQSVWKIIGIDDTDRHTTTITCEKELITCDDDMDNRIANKSYIINS